MVSIEGARSRVALNEIFGKKQIDMKRTSRLGAKAIDKSYLQLRQKGV